MFCLSLMLTDFILWVLFHLRLYWISSLFRPHENFIPQFQYQKNNFFFFLFTFSCGLCSQGFNPSQLHFLVSFLFWGMYLLAHPSFSHFPWSLCLFYFSFSDDFFPWRLLVLTFLACVRCPSITYPTPLTASPFLAR